MPKPSTFQDRLKTAMDLAERSTAELARVLRSSGVNGKLGVSVQAVNQTLRGDTKAFTAENAARAARFLNVDFFWLATGEGIPRPASAAEATIDQVVYRLGVLLGRLDDLARNAASNLLSQLAQHPEEANRIAGMIGALANEPVFMPPPAPTGEPPAVPSPTGKSRSRT